jgi:LmbE family N-acetylglucosaminyl deacetylase
LSRILAFSPHLDDAVLSASGLIRRFAARGDDVTVITLFSGVPEPPYSRPARRMHQLWRLRQAPVQRRREEDAAAHALLGSRAEYTDFLDEIYRKAPDGRWLLEDGWLRARDDGDDEQELRAELAAFVADLLASRSPDLVLACRAVGRHVDHRRTRDAVLTAAAVARCAVRLWEDLPYGQYTDSAPPLPSWATLAEPHAQPVSRDEWDAKLSAIACYRSQLTMLWPGQGREFHAEMADYARHVAAAHGISGMAERFWDVEFDDSSAPHDIARSGWRMPVGHKLDAALYDPIRPPR